MDNKFVYGKKNKVEVDISVLLDKENKGLNLTRNEKRQLNSYKKNKSKIENPHCKMEGCQREKSKNHKGLCVACYFKERRSEKKDKKNEQCSLDYKMFTGLVEALGTVIEIKTATLSTGFTLTIGDAESILTDVKLGDSIAINGTCLTVIEFTKTSFKVGISPETLDKTCLNELSIGDSVNLERAMLSTQRLGGHIVQGHVDCTVKIKSIEPVEKSLVFTFSITDPALLSMIVQKGYVCLDGVSLTVTKVDYKLQTFSIMMIEYTQEKVSLSRKNIGDLVNLEVDATFKHLSGMMMSFIAQDSSPIKDYIKACIKECFREETLQIKIKHDNN